MLYDATMSSVHRIGLRLSDEEWERFMRVFEPVNKRMKGYAPITEVVKELMGIQPLDLVTEAEASYLPRTLASPEEKQIVTAHRGDDIAVKPKGSRR